MRQNCSALTPASLSGEGSGEGRRGFCRTAPDVQPAQRSDGRGNYPI